MKNCYDSYRRIYRRQEKEKFEKSYHSFVDVQAIRKLKKGIKDVTKYLFKTTYVVPFQVFTLAAYRLYKKTFFCV